MVTDITGSYYGGRRPLTFGMRPGQFRNTRASIFPSQTIINNNIGFGGCCNFDYGCDCGNSSNKMNWMDWTMMGGIALTGIGNILSCFWGGGGGGSKEVEEKSVDTKSLKADVASYQKAYKDKCSAANVLSNGKILATINGKPQTFDSLDDFIDALNNADTDTGKPATVTPPPTQNKASQVAAPRTDGLTNTWDNVNFSGENALKITALTDPIAENVDFTNATITYSSDKGTNVSVPKTITIKANDGKEYVFELCDNKAMNIDGNPRYKCVKSGGTDLSADGMQQEYMLTTDGKFVQNESTRGTGYNINQNYNTFINNVNRQSYKQVKYNSTTHTQYNIKEGMTADAVLQACLGDSYKNLKDDEKKTLQAQLCTLNPNGMQGGVVRNLNKLNIILPKTT